jgi:hypothetical protein
MKKLRLLFISFGVILCTTLAACTVLQTQVPTGSPVTDIPDSGMPNPASVFCEQNGN